MKLLWLLPGAFAALESYGDDDKDLSELPISRTYVVPFGIASDESVEWDETRVPFSISCDETDNCNCQIKIQLHQKFKTPVKPDMIMTRSRTKSSSFEHTEWVHRRASISPFEMTIHCPSRNTQRDKIFGGRHYTKTRDFQHQCHLEINHYVVIAIVASKTPEKFRYSELEAACESVLPPHLIISSTVLAPSKEDEVNQLYHIPVSTHTETYHPLFYDTFEHRMDPPATMPLVRCTKYCECSMHIPAHAPILEQTVECWRWFSHILPQVSCPVKMWFVEMLYGSVVGKVSRFEAMQTAYEFPQSCMIEMDRSETTR